MPRRLVLSAFLLLAAGALPVRAQVVEYDIPTEYTLYPDRLAVTFNAGVDSAAARAALDDLGLTMLESDFRASTVHTVLPTPLSHTRRARLAAEAAVREVHVQPIALDRYLVAVELAPNTDRAQGLALMDGFEDALQDPGWQPARRDAVVAVTPDRQDALRDRLEAHPLVEYVSYVAQVEE